MKTSYQATDDIYLSNCITIHDLDNGRLNYLFFVLDGNSIISQINVIEYNGQFISSFSYNINNIYQRAYESGDLIYLYLQENRLHVCSSKYTVELINGLEVVEANSYNEIVRADCISRKEEILLERNSRSVYHMLNVDKIANAQPDGV